MSNKTSIILKSVPYLKGVLLLICATLLFQHLRSNWQEYLSILSNVSLLTLVLSFTTYLFFLGLTSVALYKSSRHLTWSVVNFVSYFFINSTSSVVGFLLPSGATPTRLVLLCKLLKIEKSLSLVITLRISNSAMLTNALLSLLLCSSYVFYYDQQQSGTNNLTKLLSAIALISAGLLTFNLLLHSKGANQSEKKWRYIIHMFQRASFESKTQFYTLTILSFFQTVAFAFIYKVLDNDINAGLTFVSCVLLVAINSITMLFPLTPGNIGIREGLFYFISPYIGVDPNSLVAISLIDRALQFAFFSIISASSFLFINKPLKLNNG